jgi:signal transduction histidine kinase
LNVDGTQPEQFSFADAQRLEAFASQAAAAIENAQLYRQVREHAEELTAALVRLQELDRLKSEFIQNVSHELRSPLALVRGYAEMLVSGELGELNVDQQGPVSVIARRARMLGNLVKDITLVLETEANPPQMEPIELGELAQTCVDDYRITTDQAGLTLCADIEPDLPLVDGSLTGLRRVLDNLVGNAIKFTSRGGTITVRARQRASHVVLEVSDTGIGIEDDQLDRIFERFYQVNRSSKKQYGGMGLGLALVKEVVEAHGGTVSVTSELGKGSTFAVALPTIPSAEDTQIIRHR